MAANAPEQGGEDPRPHLTASGKRCLKELENLRESAAAKRHKLRLNIPPIIDEVLSNTESNIAKLQGWINTLGRTSRPNIQSRLASERLSQLASYVDQLTNAFKRRMRDRRLYLKPKNEKNRCKEDAEVRTELRNVEKALNDLQNFIKASSANELIRAANIALIEERAREYIDRVPELGAEVVKYFKENTTLSVGLLKSFWDKIYSKPIPNDLAPDDPGDGIVFVKEDVDRAKERLTDLRKAIRESPLPAEIIEGVADLPHMSSVCLILKQTRMQRRFDDFFQRRLFSLPIDWQELSFLKEEREKYDFFCNQFRVSPKTWKNGTYNRLWNKEPTPFQSVNWPNPGDLKNYSGSYGQVTCVKNAFEPGTLYALKKQKTRDQSDQRSFFNEKNHLMSLNQFKHKHIIELCSSYFRFNMWGLLLPLADGSLHSMLTSYSDNHFPFPKKLDLATARQMLLHSLGCLSEGLSFLHEQRVRHNDIKPQNILFVSPSESNERGNWLWADFGLAFGFPAGDSKTTNNTRSHFIRYAAPEVAEAVLHYRSHSHEDQICKLCRESGAVKFERGRMADVFSFGLVCLEVLSVIFEEPYHKSKAYFRAAADDYGQPSSQAASSQNDQLTFASLEHFHKNLDQVHNWAKQKTALLEEEHNSWKMFSRMGRKMVKREADYRKGMRSIVQELRDHKWEYFCTHCKDRATENNTVSPSNVSI